MYFMKIIVNCLLLLHFLMIEFLEELALMGTHTNFQAHWIITLSSVCLSPSSRVLTNYWTKEIFVKDNTPQETIGKLDKRMVNPFSR